MLAPLLYAHLMSYPRTLALRRRRGLPVAEHEGGADEAEAVHLGEFLAMMCGMGIHITE